MIFLNNFQAKQCKIIGKNIWEKSLLTYVLSLKLKSGFSIKIKALQVYCEIFTAVIIAWFMCARDQIIQTGFTSNMLVNRILFGNYIKHVHISLELITNGTLLYLIKALNNKN